MFNIALGSNVLDGTDNNRLLVATSDYDLHPDFNENTLESDIGLIKLRMDITYTGFYDNFCYIVKRAHILQSIFRKYLWHLAVLMNRRI